MYSVGYHSYTGVILGLHMMSLKFKNLKLFLTWYVDTSLIIFYKKFQVLTMFCYRFVKVLNMPRNSSAISDKL